MTDRHRWILAPPLAVALGMAALAAAPAQDHPGEDAAAHHRETPALASSHDPLSPALRQLLVAEMREIDRAMQAVVTALARGEWGTVRDTAKRIEGTFILRQELSSEQAEELHRKLPEGFLRLDARFHASAGKLAEAAAHHDAELATFHLYRLYDACLTCHSSYASHAFPGLASGPEPHD